MRVVIDDVPAVVTAADEPECPDELRPDFTGMPMPKSWGQLYTYTYPDEPNQLYMTIHAEI
jgi:hypothetical protein